MKYSFSKIVERGGRGRRKDDEVIPNRRVPDTFPRLRKKREEVRKNRLAGHTFMILDHGKKGGQT